MWKQLYEVHAKTVIHLSIGEWWDLPPRMNCFYGKNAVMVVWKVARSSLFWRSVEQERRNKAFWEMFHQNITL